MIRLIPVTLGATSPALYGVEIAECLREGYPSATTPTAEVTVSANGSPISTGGVTAQSLTFSVVLTYQPSAYSTATRVRTFAETINVVVPTSTSVTPTIGSGVKVTPSRIGCCNKAHGVDILTSVSVAYS